VISHDLWRKERKLIHKLTSAQASSTYEPMQDLESTQLMVDMLDRPKAFWGHCQRYAGSLIMQIAFNKRANRNTDPAVADMVSRWTSIGCIDCTDLANVATHSQRALLEELTPAAVPGRHLVDSLPILNILPSFLAPWKQTAQTLFDKQETLFYGHMADVKRDIAAGQDAHCFVKYMIDMQKESGITDQQIAFLAGVMVSLLTGISSLLKPLTCICESFSMALVQIQPPMLSLLSSWQWSIILSSSDSLKRKLTE
jgi:hypothetical protein